MHMELSQFEFDLLFSLPRRRINWLPGLDPGARLGFDADVNIPRKLDCFVVVLLLSVIR